MQPTAIHRFTDRLTLGVIIVLLAAPLTYIEAAHPSWSQIRQTASDLVNKLPGEQGAPVRSSQTTTKTAQPKAAAATPAPAPKKTATTNAPVHLRSAKSVTSTLITDIPAGATVQLRDDADSSWQGVIYNGKNGYIYRDYLQY